MVLTQLGLWSQPVHARGALRGTRSISTSASTRNTSTHQKTAISTVWWETAQDDFEEREFLHQQAIREQRAAAVERLKKQPTQLALIDGLLDKV